MSEIASRTRRAVEQLGPHPAAQAGLDLADPGDRVRWLALARLASERAPQQRVLDAFRHLAAEPGAAAGDLAAAGPARVAAVLGEAGLRKPEAVARVLCRAAASLAERYRGDLDALAAECEDLEQLGSRLAALAPGLGTATVLRFLRPLRGVWQAARETPLAETARAAAVHLGLIGVGDDLDGEPAALLAACARHAPELSPIDVEAALERLGARACRSERAARCPLEDACPARGV
jgi:endonuclease III